MHKAKIYLLIVIVLSITQACSLDAKDTPPAADQNTAPADQTDSASGATTAEPQTENAPQTGNGESYLPAMDLPQIEQLTPTEGVGAKPLFEWQAVDDAAWYALVLKNAKGEAYWAWMGTQNSIYLGGVSIQPGDNIAGPHLEDGMLWAVIAYDSQDQIIAASSLRPISP